MSNHQRLEQIESILAEQNAVSIKDLARMLNVTEMTIRRDLKALSERSSVSLMRGVAVYHPHTAVAADKSPYQLEQEKGIMLEEKQRIGAAAAKLIQPNDVVFLDVGSTVEWIAKSLPENMQITAMCFAANTMNAVLDKNIGQLIMSGGYYHPRTQTFESEAMFPSMRGLRANKAFIAPAAVSMRLGLTCRAQYDVQIKRLAMNNSAERILVLTSSKFDQIRPSSFGSWEQVDRVITDIGIPDRWVKFFFERGIELEVV